MSSDPPPYNATGYELVLLKPVGCTRILWRGPIDILNDDYGSYIPVSACNQLDVKPKYLESEKFMYKIYDLKGNMLREGWLNSVQNGELRVAEDGMVKLARGLWRGCGIVR